MFFASHAIIPSVQPGDDALKSIIGLSQWDSGRSEREGDDLSQGDNEEGGRSEPMG